MTDILNIKVLRFKVPGKMIFKDFAIILLLLLFFLWQPRVRIEFSSLNNLGRLSLKEHPRLIRINPVVYEKMFKKLLKDDGQRETISSP